MGHVGRMLPPVPDRLPRIYVSKAVPGWLDALFAEVAGRLGRVPDRHEFHTALLEVGRDHLDETIAKLRPADN